MTNQVRELLEEYFMAGNADKCNRYTAQDMQCGLEKCAQEYLFLLFRKNTGIYNVLKLSKLSIPKHNVSLESVIGYALMRKPQTRVKPLMVSPLELSSYDEYWFIMKDRFGNIDNKIK
ncbi:hypothetical protein GLOIN_2v1767686 [Rhizophagus irregularis DAOM 181602=DAOM 197198]|nr:hypothetical protein RhiirB3_384780 [Rhizophagus irregularis]GET59189.1 hypothetical protein GLOIN_2v1767686 [Rhizophagus irregularis DAOM 181602=DAOM 197198]